MCQRLNSRHTIAHSNIWYWQKSHCEIWDVFPFYKRHSFQCHRHCAHNICNMHFSLFYFFIRLVVFRERMQQRLDRINAIFKQFRFCNFSSNFINFRNRWSNAFKIFQSIYQMNGLHNKCHFFCRLNHLDMVQFDYSRKRNWFLSSRLKRLLQPICLWFVVNPSFVYIFAIHWLSISIFTNADQFANATSHNTCMICTHIWLFLQSFILHGMLAIMNITWWVRVS